MKKLKKHIVWFGVLLYMTITLGFVSKGFEEILCERVNIIIEDSVQYQFVKPEDIVGLFKTMDLKIWGYKAFDIKTFEVEKTIFNNVPLVKVASAWADVDGSLNIALTQREPIVRVVNKTGQSYYIDKDANILPLSSEFTARVLVASGDIYHKHIDNKVTTLDSAVGDKPDDFILDEVFKLAEYLSQDELLKKQIEQIYVNNNTFELYPKIGTHSIKFGTVENLEDKFFKLKVIYYKGFSNLGWNKYRQIDLTYKNQVVCTKR